jgi:excisionase family DNA binding protein
VRVRVPQQPNGGTTTPGRVLPDGMECLMAIADVAAYLGVPIATVRKWNHLGTGPRPLKIGRHVKYEPAEVRQWLEARRRAG